MNGYPRSLNRCKEINVHELSKQEIYRQGFDGGAGSLIVGANPNPFQSLAAGSSFSKVGFEDIEIHFDSSFKDVTSNIAFGETKWNVPPIIAYQEVKNCVQMKIAPFYFPKIYSTYDGSVAPEYFYYKRIYLEFMSIPSNQGIFGPNNNRFHFEFEVGDLTGQSVLLTPTKDSYYFPRPFLTIDKFDVRFSVRSFATTNNSTLWKYVPIPPDTVTIRAVPGTNPIQFVIEGANTTVLGPVGVTATPGLAVVISNLNTNDATVNTAANNSNGIFITNIINNTTFEIGAINGAAVNAVTAYRASMFIPKNTYILPVRFTCVRDQFTNYMEAIHY